MNLHYPTPRYCAILGAFVAVVATLNALTASAEISPQAYENLKRDAAELLHITVTRVSVVKDRNDVVSTEVEGIVVKVERSKNGNRQGSKIKFESYYVKPEAWRNGFVGPKSPPKLYPGWSGRVYLANGLSYKGLGPAAYGKSFEWKHDVDPNTIRASSKLRPNSKVVVTATPGKIRVEREVLAELAQGTRLQIYRIVPGWAEVKVPDSEKRGWISVDDITMADERKPALAPAAPTGNAKEMAIKLTVINAEIVTLLVQQSRFDEVQKYQQSVFQKIEELDSLISKGDITGARQAQRRHLAEATAFKQQIESQRPKQ